MLHWGLLLVAVACVAGDDVKVGDKWVTFIPHAERSAGGTWTLSADAGNTIKVFCPDARFPEGNTEEVRNVMIRWYIFPNLMVQLDHESKLILNLLQERCRWSKLVVDDGVEKRSWCGTQYDFQVIGESSKLTLELILPERSAGILECKAKAVHPPKSYEEVKVAPGDGVKRFKFPEVTGEDNDKAWRFKSTTDKKISLQCKVRAEREKVSYQSWSWSAH